MNTKNLDKLGHNDVILAGYPGSGSVWLGCLLVSSGIYYLDGYHELLLDTTAQQTKKVPIKRRNRLTTYKNRDVLHQTFKEPVRVIKTHLECIAQLKQDFLRSIIIVRDPRDSILSYYHWLKSFDSLEIDFDQYLAEGKKGDPVPPGVAWRSYHESWLPRVKAGTGIVVSFEKMKQDTLMNFNGVLEFLNTPRSASVIETAIETCSFSAMQKNELNAIKDDPDNQDNGLIMRRGKPQGWKTSLTKNQIETINEQCGCLYSELGYVF